MDSRAIATIAGIAREKAIKKVMSPIEPPEGRSLMFFFFFISVFLFFVSFKFPRLIYVLLRYSRIIFFFIFIRDK